LKKPTGVSNEGWEWTAARGNLSTEEGGKDREVREKERGGSICQESRSAKKGNPRSLGAVGRSGAEFRQGGTRQEDCRREFREGPRGRRGCPEGGVSRGARAGEPAASDQGRAGGEGMTPKPCGLTAIAVVRRRDHPRRAKAQAGACVLRLNGG